MSRLISIVQSGFHLVGLHLSRWRPERSEEWRVALLANRLRIETVVDVGANVGQFGEGVVKAGFSGRIVSFEPLGVEHALLSERSRRHSNWTVAPRCAIGEQDGEAVIHRAGNSVSSSLLRMRREHAEAAPDSKTVGEERVLIRRLDHCPEVMKQTTGTVLLKVDAQGFELHVLRGASELMPRISAILLEASLVPLYDGGPLLPDLLVAAKDLGFELHDLVPGFQSPSGQMLQVNAFFVRKGS